MRKAHHDHGRCRPDRGMIHSVYGCVVRRLVPLTEECEANSGTRQVRKLYPDECLYFQVKRFLVS